jgi:hypothetical protein
LHFGPFRIDNPTTPITFNYQILNAGSQNTDKIKKALDAAAKVLADSHVTMTDWKVAAGVAATQWAASIALAGCDGAVAVDTIRVFGNDLVNWTTGNGMYTEERLYPGLDSKVGCGDNSKYSVTWSVIRL